MAVIKKFVNLIPDYSTGCLKHFVLLHLFVCVCVSDFCNTLNENSHTVYNIEKLPNEICFYKY